MGLLSKRIYLLLYEDIKNLVVTYFEGIIFVTLATSAGWQLFVVKFQNESLPKIQDDWVRIFESVAKKVALWRRFNSCP